MLNQSLPLIYRRKVSLPLGPLRLVRAAAIGQEQTFVKGRFELKLMIPSAGLTYAWKNRSGRQGLRAEDAS